MPSLKTHRRVAERLARLLRLDPRYARIGATIPDLDTIKPLKHRETLHNLPVPFLLSMLVSDRRVASILLGYLSHLATDFSPKILGNIRKYDDLIVDFIRLVREKRILHDLQIGSGNHV